MKRELREKELKDSLMELYLQNMSTACKIIDGLIPTIWKFDEKVYNARFDNAIKDYLASKEEYSQINASVNFTTSKVTIDLMFYHRSVKYNDSWRGLPSGYDAISICYKWCDSKSSSYNPDREKDLKNGFYSSSVCMVNEKKDDYFFYDSNFNIRIKASRIVDYLLEKQKELKEEISSLKKDMEKAVEWHNEVEELKEKLEKLNDSIPYTIRQFYEIKSYGVFQ
jgi:hypothetical protein